MTMIVTPASEQVDVFARLRLTMSAYDGVASMSALRDAGYGRRMLDRALTERAIMKLRRGWVALPDADPYLIAAAQRGVVVTCITQARRLGLFVFDDDDTLPHVGAKPHSGRAGSAKARIHWAEPLIPRHPDVFVDPIENVLALVASCQPYERALVVWESAFQRRLIEPQALTRYALKPAARRLLAEADVYSDSGLETLVVPRLRWLGLPLRRQIWIDGHRVDLLIGERLVLQIDGGHHVGSQREEDIVHDAALRLMGYHVIRVGYGQVVDRWHEVQDLVMRAVAQGLHRVG